MALRPHLSMGLPLSMLSASESTNEGGETHWEYVSEFLPYESMGSTLTVRQ
jgi:hypothetical protein